MDNILKCVLSINNMLTQKDSRNSSLESQTIKDKES